MQILVFDFIRSLFGAKGLRRQGVILGVGLLAIICPVSNFGATYYISQNGSDSNPGTLQLPWQSYSKAETTLVAGDTVLVQPGIYTNSSFCYPRNSGTPSAPITFKANGPVTNQFGFYILRANLIISGFTFAGLTDANAASWCYGYGIFFGKPAANVTISNCFFNAAGPIGCENGTDRNPMTMAQNLKILNNTFDKIRGGTCLMTYGTGHVIQGNTFSNGESADALRPFGSNIVIRANTFTNMHSVEGVGNHPDILQLFGENPAWGVGYWGTDILFERNLVVDCPIQLLQLEQNGVTNNSNLTLQNNVFARSVMQCSIDITGVKFFNNTFYRCNVGVPAMMQYTYFDPSDPSVLPRGGSYGGQVLNNAFIESNTLDYPGYTQVAVTYNKLTSQWVNWNNPQPAMDLVADYNFMCQPNGLPKKVPLEQHGINGGNPGIISPSTLQFGLLESSILRGKGKPIDGVKVDFNGKPRPAIPSIGAFEVDQNDQVSTPPPKITKFRILSSLN